MGSPPKHLTESIPRRLLYYWTKPTGWLWCQSKFWLHSTGEKKDLKTIFCVSFILGVGVDACLPKGIVEVRCQTITWRILESMLPSSMWSPFQRLNSGHRAWRLVSSPEKQKTFKISVLWSWVLNFGMCFLQTESTSIFFFVFTNDFIKSCNPPL